MVARHGETSDQAVLADHRYSQDGPDAGRNEVLPQPTLVGARDGDVRHLSRFQRDGGPPEYPFPLSKPCGAPNFRERSARLRRDPLDELLSRLVVFEDYAAVESRQLDGPRNYRAQHRFEVQRRTDGTSDLSQRCDLLDP